MFVPRALYIDGVAFPLEATSAGARLAIAVPALEAPQLVLARLCNADVTAEQRGIFARGEDLLVSSLAAVRMKAGAVNAREAVEAWQRFTKATMAPEDEAYVVSATFVREAMAIPRATMARLRRGARADLRRHSRRFDRGTVGARWPRCGGRGRYERRCWCRRRFRSGDRGSSADDLRRGFGGARRAQQLADDDVLRKLEDRAVLLDQLDPDDTLREGLPSAKLDALTAARRRILLLGLREAGVISLDVLRSPTAIAAARARLVSGAMPTLVGYVDAAIALAEYLGSPERARRNLRPPSTDDLLQNNVSLDWFRKRSPRSAVPTLAANDWLARCEAAFLPARPTGARAGRTYAEVGTASLWLHFRADLGPHVCLWRALRDGGNH